jgi:hypothetical protein
LGHQQNQPNAAKKKKVFDSIPIPYSQLFPHLVSNGMVVPIASLPRNPPFPAWYNAKAKCEYHAGAKGHTIENCRTFKQEVQKLVDQKLLIFKEDGANDVTPQNGLTSPNQIPYLQYPYLAAAQHLQPQGYSFQVPVNPVP